MLKRHTSEELNIVKSIQVNNFTTFTTCFLQVSLEMKWVTYDMRSNNTKRETEPDMESAKLELAKAMQAETGIGLDDLAKYIDTFVRTIKEKPNESCLSRRLVMGWEKYEIPQ